MPRQILALLCAALAALILAPAGWAADVPPPDQQLPLPAEQFYAALIGAIVPLGAYVLNHYLPFIRSDEVKSYVHVGLSALAGVLYVLFDTGDLELNTATLQIVGTTVLFALGAHAGLWSRNGRAAKLGAGSNRTD